MWWHIVDCAVLIASLLAILDYFGVKRDHPVWGLRMSLSRRWKLGLMIFLVAAALGMNGYSFYRAYRPKVIEKIVEKPVERVVTKDCPEPEIAKHQSKKSAVTKTSVPPIPVQTATGNNSAQIGGSVTTGPCSNVQVGGTNNQAATNCLPPQRHLTSAFLAAVSECLAKQPGTVGISAPSGNREAFVYAQDWYKLFSDAHWKIEPNIILSYMEVGRVTAGTEINFRGQWDGKSLQGVESSSVESNLVGCLLNTHIDDDTPHLIAQPTNKGNTVGITVGVHPSS